MPALKKSFNDVVLTGLFFFCSFTVSAQLNNKHISDHISLHPYDSNLYGISVTANTYLRNTEYFNPIELGRTLFGYQLNPSFFIQPHKNVLLQAGVYVRSDFGSDPVYTEVLPTFTLKFHKENNAFLFGTLEGALAHRLAEPLWDINSGIERRIENGFQFKHESEKAFVDVWINWEQFIERNSPFQEMFTTGFNAIPVLYHTQNNFSISLPIQFTAHHKGGQIDIDTSNTVMVFNGALGLDLRKSWKNKFITESGFSLMRMQYRENTNSGYYTFKNGNGNYANLFLQTQWLGIMLSYWNGHQFIAPRGTSIYQSVSAEGTGYTEKNRKLLFLRLLYEKEVYENFFLVVRYEPYWDLINKTSDYSYSVYISYREHFTLGKLKH